MNLFLKGYRAIHRRLAPESFARSIGVQFGTGCRFIDVDFGSEPWLVRLGNRVSATSTSFVTHDGGVWVLRPELPDIDVVRPIRVGNNVFIGSRTIILPGVSIGSNVVIGAGSVVSSNIPDDSVAAGVPARVLFGIDVYREKALASADFTKNLPPDEKKRHYTEKFGS